jgi:anaerobic selenocysteine-containing dehydrogenase
LNTRVVKGKATRQANGNVFARYEEESVDRGQKIKILYWLVANPVPPKHARIATFSYTIVQRKERDSVIMHDIQMLEKEILEARFATELGA